MLARARAAKVRIFLRPNGSLRVEPPPPDELLADLRANKSGIATLLATSIRSPDLPECPSCRGQRFWRSTLGEVGDWTCVQVPIPPWAMRVDILGPVHSKAMTVVIAFRDEASDADTFARLLVAWGTESSLRCRTQRIRNRAGSECGAAGD